MKNNLSFLLETQLTRLRYLNIYLYVFYRYYTVPPEQPSCHISAEIVSQINKEFDIDSFVAEEKMMLDTFEGESAKKQIGDSLLIESSGPVTSLMEIEKEKEKVSYAYLHAFAI